MTADVIDRPRPPRKPPRILPYIAVLLELGIVATLTAERSGFGLLLCVGYGYFSATWAMFADAFDSNDES